MAATSQLRDNYWGTLREGMDFQSAMDTFVEAWMAANTKTDQVQVFINCYCYYYYYYFAARLSPSRIVRLKSLLRNRGVNRLTARWLKSNPLPSQHYTANWPPYRFPPPSCWPLRLATRSFRLNPPLTLYQFARPSLWKLIIYKIYLEIWQEDKYHIFVTQRSISSSSSSFSNRGKKYEEKGERERGVGEDNPW